MKLRIQKLHPKAQVPTYAHMGDACFDLYSIDAGTVDEPTTFGTGLAFEIPAGYMMLIFSRSGHGFNHAVRLSNCVGVIDSAFRKQVMVRLTPDDDSNDLLHVKVGDRIAQACVLPVEMTTFELVDNLSPTDRGAGFGSSGA